MCDLDINISRSLSRKESLCKTDPHPAVFKVSVFYFVITQIAFIIFSNKVTCVRQLINVEPVERCTRFKTGGYDE